MINVEGDWLVEVVPPQSHLGGWSYERYIVRSKVWAEVSIKLKSRWFLGDRFDDESEAEEFARDLNEVSRIMSQ